MTNLFTNDENKSLEKKSLIRINSVNIENGLLDSSVSKSSDSNSAIKEQNDNSSEKINSDIGNSVKDTNNANKTTENNTTINKTNITIAENNQTIIKNTTELNNNKDIKALADATDYKKVGQYAGAPPAKFTKNELLSAATALKKYVEKYGKLPDYLTLDGTKLAMSDFLYLLSKLVINTNGGSNSDITSKDVKDPSYPSGSSTNGNLYKSGYMDLAKRVAAYIDNHGQAPNYGNSNLGEIQFQTMIYGFAKIADYFKVHKVMPNYVSFTKSVSANLNKVIPKYSRGNGLIVSNGDTKPDDSKPGDSGSEKDDKATSTGPVSLAKIKDAGARVEIYIEKNGVLPKYVTIDGKDYSMTQFLYLTSKAIVNINKGITGTITAKTFKDPSEPSGSSINGNIYKSNFLDLAKRVSNYMIDNGQAPNYGSSTLGKMQFQTMIYGFSMILEFAKSEGRLPNYLTIKVSSSNSLNKYFPKYEPSIPSEDTEPKITTKIIGSNDKGKVELIGVFGNINSKTKIAYIIGQHPLEANAHNSLYNLINAKTNSLKYCYYLYKITVTKNPSDYSQGRMNGQLLAQQYVLPHILVNNYDFIIDIHSNQGTQGGNYEKTNFIFAPLNHTESRKIAEALISQIPGLSYYYPSSQTSPAYLTNPLVNAGIPTILYETYMYESLNTTNNLMTQLLTKIDAYNFVNPVTPTGTISLADIMDASARVKAYVENKGVLPNYVTIGTTDYSMTNFLYLLSTAIKNINSGITTGIKPISAINPSYPTGDIISGELKKSAYVDLALRVSNYIAANKQAPNYGGSTLGNIQFQSLVYELSKVLNYMKNNGVLPNSLTIDTNNPSTLNGGSGSDTPTPSGDLAKYLKSTKNCQVNDASIIAKAKELTRGLTSELAKANAIFNFVRDSVEYRFYYDTNKTSGGAKNVLNQRWGNCVDKTHLLIALSRASGIAARYVNGECDFTQSGWIGHVWAEIYVDGKWVIADTSTRYNSFGIIKNWNTKTNIEYGKYAEILF